ncbi:MAG TPA: SDR family NAD(P)-dependent oxidoreductase [Casimicrobiaceae bacterium]|nr:SDR family NAD(P)-dependent oxidoreductase [Casimicrobiaceae bacterium]
MAAELGDVSGLIASSGIAGAAKAEGMRLEELNNVFAVNVGGVLSTCQAFVRGMIERRSGAIVLIGTRFHLRVSQSSLQLEVRE